MSDEIRILKANNEHLNQQVMELQEKFEEQKNKTRGLKTRIHRLESDNAELKARLHDSQSQTPEEFALYVLLLETALVGAGGSSALEWVREKVNNDETTPNQSEGELEASS